jgi:hypothetical protein
MVDLENFMPGIYFFTNVAGMIDINQRYNYSIKNR